MLSTGPERIECPTCLGSGLLGYEVQCPICQGTGKVERSQIPFFPGDRVRYYGSEWRGTVAIVEQGLVLVDWDNGQSALYLEAEMTSLVLEVPDHRPGWW